MNEVQFLQEPDDPGIIYEPSFPVKVQAFRVGDRLFKTAYGGWRHLAKIHLLDELHAEMKVRYPKVQECTQDYKTFRDSLFREKYTHAGAHSYGSSYDGSVEYWSEPSSFGMAVTKKAKELMAKHRALPYKVGEV